MVLAAIGDKSGIIVTYRANQLAVKKLIEICRHLNNVPGIIAKSTVM